MATTCHPPNIVFLPTPKIGRSAMFSQHKSTKYCYPPHPIIVSWVWVRLCMMWNIYVRTFPSISPISFKKKKKKYTIVRRPYFPLGLSKSNLFSTMTTICSSVHSPKLTLFLSLCILCSLWLWNILIISLLLLSNHLYPSKPPMIYIYIKRRF